MKISVNWIKQFTEVNLPIGELVRKIGAQLGEVEQVTDLGAKYQGIVIAKVVSVSAHPNADKLHICKIDDGQAASDLPRDAHGLVQVVTAAPNVRPDMFVAWLPPGSTVPSTYGPEPFVLEPRELRGVLSQGMLASARELLIGDDHSGILDLDAGLRIRKKIAGEIPHAQFASAYSLEPVLQPGADFAKTYGLDDHIIEVENKMFTHRPDCFGILGLAREIAGIQNQPFRSPAIYLHQPADPSPPTSHQLEIKNELPQLVPRFLVQLFTDVTVGPSSVIMQSYLNRVGIRPINNIVDITNYYMYLTGQPLHAYDYDKLKALDGQGRARLTIRHPQVGEKLTLLNGKTITPRPDAIMIATAERLIGVGGVMGGATTEVDANTKNIVLECANFDMYSVRRTAMAHGLFTDAVTRFNKGQSPLQNDRVLAWAAQDVICLSGAQAGAIYDIKTDLWRPAPIKLRRQFVNDRLGLGLTAGEMAQRLQNVEFDVHLDGDQLQVDVPFWRTDIAAPEDIVEEVGRLHGYDHLPLQLPQRTLTPAKTDQLLGFKQRLRAQLSRAGANELLTYSFVHGQLLERVGQTKAQAFQLSNALSPDLQYYRLSLTPSLLDKVHANIKADYIRSDDNEFALFELGKVHRKDAISPVDGLPQEFSRLALVFAADAKTAARKYHGPPYYQAKAYLMNLLTSLGLAEQVRFSPLQPELYQGSTAHQITMYQPGRSATIMLGQAVLGEIGEYKTSVRRALKLPDFTAGFELNVDLLLEQARTKTYQPLPRFPKIQQDLSFRLPRSVTCQQLNDTLQQALTAAATEHNYHYNLDLLDIYQPDPAHVHMTVRLWLWQPARTLTTKEANHLQDQLAATAAAQHQAVRL